MKQKRQVGKKRISVQNESERVVSTVKRCMEILPKYLIVAH